ncbi:MAG: hypothetical protein GXP31_07540 [Kiritimatiellaeota bacterium]|nr:hypothetical protein [Kiritimatiellota bacterium]
MQAKRILKSLGLSVPLVLLVAGCRSTNTIVRVQGLGESTTAPTPQKAPATDTMMRVADADQLHVAVTASPAANADERVAAGLAKDVTGALVKAGYSVDAKTPDVAVSLTPEIREKDRLGSSHVFEGKVDAHAERVADRKILGQRVFKAGGRRELGRDKALDALTAALAPDVREWAVNVCRPGNVGLEARTVQVKLRSKKVSDVRFAADFVRQVQGIDGVTSCKLAGQDYGKREMNFRVVYMPEKLPQGLLNAIADLPGLQLEPQAP